MARDSLNESWFLSLTDARRIIEAWRQDYNATRPHSSLGYLTPEEFEQRTLNRAEPAALSTYVDELRGQVSGASHWAARAAAHAVAEVQYSELMYGRLCDPVFRRVVR